MTWKLDPNASWKSPGFSQGPDHPAVGVSWQEAVAFCKWLTAKERSEGRLLPSQSYRLPTEADWNAAAAGIGCDLDAPFMTLSFLSLSPIPELKLTDQGLIDAVHMKHTSLYAKSVSDLS